MSEGLQSVVNDSAGNVANGGGGVPLPVMDWSPTSLLPKSVFDYLLVSAVAVIFTWNIWRNRCLFIA
jgi:hypothetical protein